MSHKTATLSELRDMHRAIAEATLANEALMPVFQRLDSELSAMEAQEVSDPVAQLRARLAQRAIA